MSKRIKIERNSEGIRELLLGPEVSKLLNDVSEKIARDANTLAGPGTDEKPEYVVKGPKVGSYGGGRQIAYVAAGNSAAFMDESRNHTIERALGGGVGKIPEDYSKRVWVNPYTRKDGKQVAGHWRYYKKKDE